VVAGPGVLAGLSDDDPPGITTYSVLGADYGYRLIWVLTLSTVALVVFHEVAARTGVVTGKGAMRLVRERYGGRVAAGVLSALVVANIGTLCAELAGLAAALDILAGVSRYVTVPLGATAVALLVLRGSFHRIEHVLLALAAVFVAYIAAGVLAHPDWAAAGRGLVVPSMPAGRDALLAVVAGVGTTLAPWGLVFIQSYAVDKRLKPRDLAFERVDVVTGAVMTGVIGFFVIIACAATLHVHGLKIDDAGDAARALEPLAGSAASDLFGIGFLGAALLGVAIVPLSTAYSVAETVERPADLDLRFGAERLFYLAYGGALVVAGGTVLIPGVPLVRVLYLSQALNAVLLLAILPFIRAIARDASLMGRHRLGRSGSVATGMTIAAIGASVVALFLLQIT
jgi:NRAMP (natural resistance-associated macrophage protein)-like metal ion transporter